MLRNFVVLAAFGVGVLIAGVGLSKPRISDANLAVDYDPDDSALECDTSRACFNLSSQRPISNVYVDVTFTSSVDPAPFEITVNGKAVSKERLRTTGGQCDKGGKKLPRKVWFQPETNTNSAQVCVIIDDAVPAEVRVGARSSEECNSDATTAACSRCSEVDDPADEEEDSVEE